MLRILFACALMCCFVNCSDESAAPVLRAESADGASNSQTDSWGTTGLDAGTLADARIGSGDSASATDSFSADVNENPWSECESTFELAATWFDEAPIGPLDGTIEFGQTHVMAVDDTRIGPDLVAHRESLLLFTPNDPLPASADIRVAAYLSDSLVGVLRMQTPDKLPPPLEASVTTSPLAPYSKSAWSATLPWDWIRNGVNLRVGASTDAGLSVLNYQLSDLAAPHEFTLTRTHMVLFGEDDFAVVPVHPAPKVARDMAPWVPGSLVKWVDTSAWRLDRVVVNTADGPRWAASEDERVAITTDDTRWNIIKHQGALRLSLANTGRGLRYTLPPEGDNSPFSYGTSMVQGWVRLNDGTYTDVNNAGLAAGWTGWSGMWLDECGNGFIHEVGHTMTLLHFTEGTAFGWGIDNEYPKDGTWLSSHPWGYDTVRRRFRTWYRVQADGPVVESGAFVGKRDPMNGGESANQLTCFPPYTAYQMKRSLDWLESTPTLLNLDGVPGAYRWNRAQGEYVAAPVPADVQTPIAVGVPVATLTGTLGNVDDVCQTYPPIMIPAGNVFDLPDPLDPNLMGFGGAQWFVAVTYGDGDVDYGLINRTAVAETDTSLYLYSLNVALNRNPQSIQLFRSATGYPNVDVVNAELIHSRDISSLPSAEAPVLMVGQGHLANDLVRLSDWCEPGLNCEARSARSDFPVSDVQLSFKPTGSENADTLCGQVGAADTWTVPVVSEVGDMAEVQVHARRHIASDQSLVKVPASDRSPWLAAANLRQSLVLHIPYEPNKGLAAGRWTSPSHFMITVLRDGVGWREIPLAIDITVHETESVQLPPAYVSAGVSIASSASPSSIFFTFDDPSIGPNTPKWWGDDTGNIILVPVLDVETGTPAQLTLRGHKLACGSEWEMNTGQSADWGCSHQVRLRIEPGANNSLLSGHTYASPPSTPVVIRGRRWHEPGADTVLQTLALLFNYTAP